MNDWGTCTCGHPIYEHTRLQQDGNQVWKGCRIPDCVCIAWRASDMSNWPNGPAGVKVF